MSTEEKKKLQRKMFRFARRQRLLDNIESGHTGLIEDVAKKKVILKELPSHTKFRIEKRGRTLMGGAQNV